MDIKEKICEFKIFQKKLHAFKHSLGLLSYDSETTMPKGATSNMGNTIAVLSEELYKLVTSKEIEKLLDYLNDSKEQLDAQTLKELEIILKDNEELRVIPMEEYIEFQVTKTESGLAWRKAKENNNFEIFKPSLKKMIEFQKKFASYKNNKEANLYNTILNDYEKGLTVTTLDKYFDIIKKELVPLISKISIIEKVNYLFMNYDYPIYLQKDLSNYLMDVLTINKNYCVLGETEHPFSTHFHKTDVRITTHYYKKNVFSSLYSVLHEGGHGLYELNTSDSIQNTVLANGTSMSIHESQSRFFENVIGRSFEFCELVLPKLQNLFPVQFKDITTSDLYNAVNIVSPSLIRIEADELTYSMHILIRYEIEKAIFVDDYDVDQLPKLWNELYKKYLGIDVTDDASGILQDVHWSAGLFGYFPSYSIGSAYASQIASKMKEKIDLNKCIKNNDLKPVVDWLTEHIYKYGKMLSPEEVIKNSCNEDFDSQYYVSYLVEKYTKIYNL